MNASQTAYKKAYDAILAAEDRYYDLAYKALEKGNMQANIMHSAEASAFQRARYILEDCFGGLEKTNG